MIQSITVKHHPSNPHSHRFPTFITSEYSVPILLQIDKYTNCIKLSTKRPFGWWFSMFPFLPLQPKSMGTHRLSSTYISSSWFSLLWFQIFQYTTLVSDDNPNAIANHYSPIYRQVYSIPLKSIQVNPQIRFNMFQHKLQFRGVFALFSDTSISRIGIRCIPLVHGRPLHFGWINPWLWLSPIDSRWSYTYSNGFEWWNPWSKKPDNFLIFEPDFSCHQRPQEGSLQDRVGDQTTPSPWHGCGSWSLHRSVAILETRSWDGRGGWAIQSG